VETGRRTDVVKMHQSFCLSSNIIIVRNMIQWVGYAARVEEIRNVYNILARETLKRPLGESWPVDRIIIQ
jgi:hypothetical protein